MTALRTQVAIVGAGPAGLTLAQILHRRGIESILIERRGREYVERRLRAGVLEQGTVDLLHSIGVGDRMDREGLVHHGVHLQFVGERHRIALSELTGGRAITVYGQHEVVKDLIAARLAYAGQIFFDADAVQLGDIETEHPVVRFHCNDTDYALQCDFIAGCDGSHGSCRSLIPAEKVTTWERKYPCSWLGILAAVPPSLDEIIYAWHERGFALHSMRTPEITRLYVQCPPDDELSAWPDERVWGELMLRLATTDGWSLQEGAVLEKSISAMRSFVMEPMQHGRLYLAGDAAHVVPPTGAKGMNLAIADVRVLGEAIATWYRTGDPQPLERYSSTCLRRVWRAEHFSWWMTTMLHRFPGDDDFQAKLQLAQLRYVCTSTAAATSFAENYVGLEHV
ncbi:MAG TPA: 4-hydroxybenzoate 3-monooxygenase [Gemmatimonadaceae bacterium]|nr:4-hydroxybenzoate 3-monooxygenase [Gemmatimonadaceae bacterium]